MAFYIVKGGRRMGPLSDDEFYSLVLSGEIGLDTLVWRPGMADWQSYAAFSDAESSETPKTVAVSPVVTEPPDDSEGVCVECGTRFPEDELVVIAGSGVCAGCKATHLQRLREGAMLPSAFNYGGFWIRFVAKFIDNLILGIAGLAVQMGLLGLSISASAQPGQFNFEETAVSWLV